jgi:hypothetical protein
MSVSAVQWWSGGWSTCLCSRSHNRLPVFISLPLGLTHYGPPPSAPPRPGALPLLHTSGFAQMDEFAAKVRWGGLRAPGA